METENRYYPERIASIVVEHELILPADKEEFIRYVRGW
jgi:hypothetical protein